MTRARRGGLALLAGRTLEDDPLAGVANLFDAGIVFALGFLVALVSALHLLEMFDPRSTVTIATERDGELTVTVKRGKEIEVRRLTKQVGSGDGTRLGVAYRLKDGTVVYIPDDEEETGTERPGDAPPPTPTPAPAPVPAPAPPK